MLENLWSSLLLLFFVASLVRDASLEPRIEEQPLDDVVLPHEVPRVDDNPVGEAATAQPSAGAGVTGPSAPDAVDGSSAALGEITTASAAPGSHSSGSRERTLDEGEGGNEKYPP